MTVNYDASWSFNLDQNHWENSSILGCKKNGLESIFLVIILVTPDWLTNDWLTNRLTD